MPVLTLEDHLKWAHHQYESSNRRERYKKYARYYDGEHPLAFATEKFRSVFGQTFQEFAENLIPAVVDSLADRLEITSFKTSAATVQTEDVAAPPLFSKEGVPPRQKVNTVDPFGDQAWDIWERNQMLVGANEVHVESILMGDSYVIVWPDDQGLAEIWPQKALEMSVRYDPNVKERLLSASKCWFDDLEMHWRLNVYTEEAIFKYQSIRMNDNHPESTFPTSPKGWTLIDEVNNPYPRVPVFHFPNKAIRKWGMSRVKDVLPIQDGLNKSVMDLLVTMEFAAYKQRYIIGAEPENIESGSLSGDPSAAPLDQERRFGIDRMLGIPDPEAKVGQFDATDLKQFLDVQEKFWASAARVSGTPLHYFFITSGDFPSGEAMKSAEARFIKEIADQQGEKGAIWGEVMLFALQIESAGVPEDLEVNPLWTDASPRSESELADTAVKKQSVGVPSSQILRELGYSEEEIDRFMQETMADKMTKFLMEGQRQQENQNGGQQPGNRQPGNRQRSTAQPAGENTRGVRQ